MRLFLALNLPSDVRSRSFEAVGPLRMARPDVRWVPESNLHLTLKFLGEQPEELVTEIGAAMDAVAAGTRPIDLRVGRVGAFPTLRRPRIVYLTVAPDPKLELLHHDVEIACAALEVPIDGTPFRPHITIGRESDGVGLDARRLLREAARQVRLTTTAPVASIDLMVSARDGAGGPRHGLVHRSPFRDR